MVYVVVLGGVLPPHAINAIKGREAVRIRISFMKWGRIVVS
jgi:hypothetical protein